MNVAVIIAGGSGQRMGQDIPKQFINVYDKPVLIYTLESFQRNDLIDAIEVVCIDGWHNVLWAYAKQFNITKVKWVISGGNSAQESIRNGVYNLKDVCMADDNIIIHDGIRPLVDDEVSTTKYIPRETLRRVSTPQAYKFDKLVWAYEKAFAEEIGIYGSSYTNTMMVELGERLYFAKGSDKNIKLTTKDDLEIFKGYLTAEKDKWLK